MDMRWAFLALTLVPPAHAGDNKVQVSIDNAIRLPQFFERFSKTVILYPPDNARFRKTYRTGNIQLRVREELVDRVYQSVLAFHEIEFKPCGPGVVFASFSRRANAQVKHRALAQHAFARGTHKVGVAGMGVSMTLELAYPLHAYSWNKKWLRDALLPSSRRALATLLRHGKPRARTFAARLLGLFGSHDEAASHLLRKALSDKDATVRFEAKRALDRANRERGRKKK